MPWARLHPTISPSLERKRICNSFILSKLFYHFTMVTLQKAKNIITRTTLQLKIHSILRMLQYLWHGRVCMLRIKIFTSVYACCVGLLIRTESETLLSLFIMTKIHHGLFAIDS